jgi:hypothetical protein
MDISWTEMRPESFIFAGKEKRPLRGVEPKMLSSAGLVLRIMLPFTTPVNRDVAPASGRCGP